MSDSYFRHHVLFCTNQRAAGEECCQNHDTLSSFAYTKQRIKELHLNAPGQVRISKAGCLGRCEDGPLLVIYPEAVWYTWVDESDLDEIIQQHLQQGQVVQRLLIDR